MKKIIYILSGMCLCMISVINWNWHSTIGNTLPLTIANIEALAHENSNPEWISCYETITNYGKGDKTHQTYCGECAPKLVRGWSDSSSCQK